MLTSQIRPGHDNGLIVFKLERERPAFAMHGDMLYYIRDKYVRSYDINTGSDIGLLSVRKFGSPYVPPRTLSYNPAERAVVVTISSDNGLFELTSLPKDAVGEVKDSSTDGKRGSGQAAIFVARNRFAVLNKTSQVMSAVFALSLLLLTSRLARRGPGSRELCREVHQASGANKRYLLWRHCESHSELSNLGCAV